MVDRCLCDEILKFYEFLIKPLKLQVIGKLDQFTSSIRKLRLFYSYTVA